MNECRINELNDYPNRQKLKLILFHRYEIFFLKESNPPSMNEHLMDATGLIFKLLIRISSRLRLCLGLLEIDRNETY